MKTTIFLTVAAAMLVVLAPAALAEPTDAFVGTIERGVYQKPNPSTPGINTTGLGRQTWGDSDPVATLGLDFEVIGPHDITVWQLGIWDDNGDGLVTDHWLRLWDLDTQIELASVYTLAGTGELRGGYRYFDIAPLVIPTGARFVVSVFYPDVPGTHVDSNGNSGAPIHDLEPTPIFNSNGVLNIGSARYLVGADAFPGTPDWLGPSNRYHAGSFSYSPNPEPGTMLLLGGALMAAGLIRRRRRQAQQSA